MIERPTVYFLTYQTIYPNSLLFLEHSPDDLNIEASVFDEKSREKPTKKRKAKRKKEKRREETREKRREEKRREEQKRGEKTRREEKVEFAPLKIIAHRY